jgi:ABC-type Mn2+/Zn2+ transport system ATPase subunit
LQAAKAQYDAAVQAGGGDYKIIAQKRARTMKELDAAQATLAALKAKADRIKALDATRGQQLVKLKTAYEAYSNERKARCAKIQNDTGGRLQVGISESSDGQDFKVKLLSLKKGSYLRDSEIERICEKSDPATFSRAIIRFGMHRENKHIADLAEKVAIDLSRMATLAEFMVTEFNYETLLGLEYNVMPQDRPEIKYAIGNGTFESLSKLSVGQKCTAMLMIALSEGTAPVVIDQPEDSLDIRSIWEDICSRIRLGKERRQFIFTTHSSSVAVASDSDKFIILEGGATHSDILFSGSMDHSPVSQKVLDYLEGGDKTYRAKYKKYNADLN